MMDWLQEHKKYVLSAAVVVVLLIFYLISTFFNEVNVLGEGGWEETEGVLNEMDEDLQTEEEMVDEEILVDVKGAVLKPGVYKATVGDRVIDLIDKAGGLGEGANEKAINFAERVTDEMVLYVPMIGEEAEEMVSTLAGSTGGDPGKINLNTASQTELETLPGIGPAKAQAIIDYRENSGPFKAIEDIRSISGFGEKTFEKLKEHISVK